MKVPSLCFVLIAIPRILVPDPIGRDNGALHKIFAKALNLHIRDAVQHPVRIEIDAIVLGAPLVPDDVLGLEAVLGQVAPPSRSSSFILLNCTGRQREDT